MNDWSELIVRLQPLSRKLEETLNRREYTEAEVTASELADVVNDLYRFAIKQQLLSGVGYK